MMDCGSKLRRLRKEKGISQRQMAKMFNISNATLSLYESNIRIPGAETLCQFADFFDVSVDYLLGRKAYCPILRKPIDQAQSIHCEFSKNLSVCPLHDKKQSAHEAI
jgi:transcriptional regulator with XRE-family HTH domain